MTSKSVGRGVAAIVIVMLLAPDAPARQAPHATAEHGVFAFADRSGTQLIALGDLSQPDALKTAVCSAGRRVPVQFVRRQPAAEGDRKQTADNFDKLSGTVFRLVHDHVAPEETCFVARDSFLPEGAVLGVTPPGDAAGCSTADRRRFTARRGRRVVNCWPIAHLPPDKHLALVEFARQGKSALASLVLLSPGGSIFADYPAEYRGNGEDLWRVDDGGALSPDGFRIVFAVQRKEYDAVAVSWSGAEGESLSLFVSERGGGFREVINEYWYRPPQ